MLVHEGIVLIKIGKHEYALQANQSFWLPIDCLSSVTYFPGALTSEIHFSIRLPAIYSTQAGYVNHTSLTEAAIEKLRCSSVNTELQSYLLNVLKYECADLLPELSLNQFSQSFNRWRIGNKTEISNEINMALTIREARKRLLSGTPVSLVIDELFSGSQSIFEQIWLAMFGRAYPE